MDNPWDYILLAICAAAFGYQCVALIATLRYTRSRDANPSTLPPISILKPIHGADPNLYEAIRSHATQDYREFELIFGISNPQDAAVGAIKRLQVEFPQLPIKLVHCPPVARNPKVSKLIELVQHARYSLLLVNDSDIRAKSDYLKRIVAPLVNSDKIGLVTALYRVESSSLPGQWISLGIATDFAPSALVAPFMGVKEFALGSTLLFRKKDLDAIGGYQAFSDYVADDYQLAKRISAGGHLVHLSRAVVGTSIQESSWRGIWRHQVRWQKMIRVSRGGGYLGLPITFATFWTVLAAALGHWEVALALFIVRMAVVLVSSALALRCPASKRVWFLAPLRDLWGVAVWLAGFFGNKITWRGDLILLRRDGRILESSASMTARARAAN